MDNIDQLGQKLTDSDINAMLSTLNQTALVSVTNTKGEIIYANQKFVEVSKYTLDELIGQNHRILKSGHQPYDLFIDLWQTIESGKVWRGEIKNRAKDGSYYWVDTSIAPIMGPDGKPDRYISVRFLITERKDKEETLDGLLSALNQTALVSISDKKGDIIYANQRFAEVSKFNLYELIGQNHRILKSGHQPYDLFIDLWQTIESGKVWRGEIKNRAKDGSYYWVDTSIAPIMGPDGKPDRYISVRFLITDKKHREQLLEEAKAKNEAILTSIGDGIISTDPSGIVQFMNPKAEELLGWKTGEAIGKRIVEVLPVENEEGHSIPFDERPIQQALASKKSISSSSPFYYVRRDKSRIPVAITVAPIILNGEVIGAIDVFRDVTHEKEVDRTKTEFVSLASHQLRTPATGVKQYLGLLLEGHAGEIANPIQCKFLQTAYESNERQLRVVSDLLQVAKADAGKISISRLDCDLVEIVQAAVAAQKDALTARQQTAKFVTEKPEVRVPADKDYVFTIMENLLENAIKYSPDNTTITVTVKSTPKWAYISVSDQGVGIAKKDIPKLFQKFSRIPNPMSKAVDGSGLGLYWVKKIVDLHDGDVKVESEVGKGTTICVKFPRETPRRKTPSKQPKKVAQK